MKSLIAKSNTAKARVASIKERGGVLAVLKTEGGAIDLASIMVGVLVIGIIGGVIAATVFAVIPWSQDQAASQALASVSTAESVQYSFSSGQGTAAYATDTVLEGTSNAAAKSLLQASPHIVVAISTNASSYIAASKSATGTQFYTFSNAPSTVLSAAAAQTKLTADIALGAAGIFQGITALPVGA